mgnify:CR=1 FL=1
MSEFQNPASHIQQLLKHDHFDELNILADKDSEFFLKTIELIRSTVNAKK